jgi:AraC family transcriptional regulator
LNNRFGRLTSKQNCRLNSWLDRFLDRMSKPRTDGKVDSSCFRANLLRLREVAGLSLTEATYPPDLQVPPHSHEEAHFCLLLQGRYEENCGKDLIIRKPSTLALMAGGAIHSNRIHSTGIRFFSIEMTRSWLNRAKGCLAFIRGLTQFDTGPLPWLAMRLYREFRCEDDVAPLAIEGLLLELLAGVTRQTFHSENGNAKWLSRARDFVHDRFQESISLAEVAEFAGVHPVSLARAFRRMHHCTVGEYVRKLRIEFACQKLTASDESLVEIAFSAGFSEQSHLCRTFKRLTGLTPSEYRSNSRRG